MPVKRIGHYNIATDDLEANISFYRDVIGLRLGDSLPGVVNGAYFSIESLQNPVVHIIDVSNLDAQQIGDFKLDAEPHKSTKGDFNTGALDHIAFDLDKDDYKEMLSRIQGHKLKYFTGDDLGPEIRQIWVYDPNGIKVELSFS